MQTQQLILGLVLALMVFSVALDLQPDDFRRVLAMPRAVVAGLVPQFLLLPVGTWPRWRWTCHPMSRRR